MVGEVDPAGNIGNPPANRRGQDAPPAHCRLEQVVGPALPARWDVTSMLTVLTHQLSHLARNQLLADGAEPRAPAIPLPGAPVTSPPPAPPPRDVTRPPAAPPLHPARLTPQCPPHHSLD